jgi:DNA (cytosine-5)-methyltransferase 1
MEKSSSKPSFIDCCCGSGGLSLGFEQAGWSCCLAIDSVPDCCETFHLNFPSVPLIEASVHDVRPRISDVDAVIAGIPCPSHSMSGKRKGLQDERGLVVDGVLGIIRSVQPKIVVFENVPGLVSAPGKDGKKGGALEYILAETQEAGYTPTHEILNAWHHGAPQARPRIFIVASRDGAMWIPPDQVLPRPVVYDALWDLLGVEEGGLPNHTFMKHRPETVEAISKLAPGDSLYEKYTESWRRLGLDIPAPTQKENHGALSIHPLENRCISPREMARLQGFPDDFVFLGSKSSVIKQIGNAVPVPLARAVAKSILPML